MHAGKTRLLRQILFLRAKKSKDRLKKFSNQSSISLFIHNNNWRIDRFENLLKNPYRFFYALNPIHKLITRKTYLPYFARLFLHLYNSPRLRFPYEFFILKSCSCLAVVFGVYSNE